jgi:FkbM family methyltransferase
VIITDLINKTRNQILSRSFLLPYLPLLWEGQIAKKYCQAARGKKLIVDVGAFLGYYSGLARKVNPHAAIFAFEPNPRTFRLLQRNVATSKIRTLNLALSDKVGSTMLFVPEKAERSSLERNWVSTYHLGHVHSTVQIRTTTIDEFFPNETIDLLKIDAEGHEMKILGGAIRAISEDRIKTILMEYSVLLWNDAERNFFKYLLSKFNGMAIHNSGILGIRGRERDFQVTDSKLPAFDFMMLLTTAKN